MQVEEPSWVSIDGRRIAYNEVSPPHPKGTVLLLAGADSNRLIWYKQLDVFGRAFRTIALDYRDTGDSDPVSKPYTIADLADDAVQAVVERKIVEHHVAGGDPERRLAADQRADHIVAHELDLHRARRSASACSASWL